jgi:hypothetical protein
MIETLLWGEEDLAKRPLAASGDELISDGGLDGELDSAYEPDRERAASVAVDTGPVARWRSFQSGDCPESRLAVSDRRQGGAPLWRFSIELDGRTPW